jgi:hypothetical protein
VFRYLVLRRELLKSPFLSITGLCAFVPQSLLLIIDEVILTSQSRPIVEVVHESVLLSVMMVSCRSFHLQG